MSFTNTPTRRQMLKMTGLGTVGAIAGCLSGSGGGYNRTVGVVLPQSGGLGVAGEKVLQGMRVALEQANESLDESVELNAEDSAGDAAEARSVVQGMIEDNYPVIIGPISSDVGLSVSELAEEEEVPFMPSVGAHVDIAKPGKKYSFRFPTPSAIQMALGSSLFLEQRDDVSTVALISTDYSYGRNFAKYHVPYLENAGIEVAVNEFFPFGTENFLPAINKINNDEVDAIAAMYNGANQISLINQLHEEGLYEDNLIYSASDISSNSFIDALGEEMAGMYVFQAGNPNNETFRSIDSTFQDEYGEPADVYASIGYDNARVAIESMAQADSLDPTSIRDAMRELDYSNGAMAQELDFNDYGRNDGYRELVTQFRMTDGQLSRDNLVFTSDPLAPPHPSTNDFPDDYM